MPHIILKKGRKNAMKDELRNHIYFLFTRENTDFDKCCLSYNVIDETIGALLDQRWRNINYPSKTNSKDKLTECIQEAARIFRGPFMINDLLRDYTTEEIAETIDSIIDDDKVRYAYISRKYDLYDEWIIKAVQILAFHEKDQKLPGGWISSSDPAFKACSDLLGIWRIPLSDNKEIYCDISVVCTEVKKCEKVEKHVTLESIMVHTTNDIHQLLGTSCILLMSEAVGEITDMGYGHFGIEKNENNCNDETAPIESIRIIRREDDPYASDSIIHKAIK